MPQNTQNLGDFEEVFRIQYEKIQMIYLTLNLLYGKTRKNHCQYIVKILDCFPT
jgi:hypothetical protein